MFRVRVKVYRLLTAALPQPLRKGSAFPVMVNNIQAATPPRQSLKIVVRYAGKPEAFRTEAAKPQPKAAPKAENEQASTHKVAYNLDHDG